MLRNRIYVAIAFILALGTFVPTAHAQNAQQPMNMPMNMSMDTPGWHFMQDAVVFGMFNHQGGPRGGDEFKVPNWWMGMFSRKLKSSQLTFNAMLSLDPATVGEGGYREILQVGEALDGHPLIDHQHPHDLFMHLAGAWRMALTETTGLTVAGGPVGEPTLGPVAFMHRASAAENPLAPLGHHVVDSSHIAFGVIMAAIDRGPWVVEGSVFNGREPDQHRWDFDFGALDSFAGRIWFKPDAEWEFQISSGRLKHPEQLEEGDITRTTASAGWMKAAGENFSAVTVGYGRNDRQNSAQNSVFSEGTWHQGANSIFGRLEVHQFETTTLALDVTPAQLRSTGVSLPQICPSLVHCVEGKPVDALDTLVPFTIGGVRDILRWRGFEGGIGAAATFYAVPEALKATHGDHPVSIQIFFRLRPPAGPMGRMWNMRMSQPMNSMSGMNHQMD